MKISEVLAFLEKKYPLHYQEDFDNCGIQCGDKSQEITGVLVCFEMSEATIDEALRCGANLIISHHPLILRRGLFKIEPTTRVGKVICKALENKLVLYAMHTNLDSAVGGVNDIFARKLALKNVRVLAPHNSHLRKICVFVPHTHTELVTQSLFSVGCGQIGNYKNCSYTMAGTGTFCPTAKAHPFIGTIDTTEQVQENKIELIFPEHLQKNVIEALYRSHPYEEPAFDIFQLANEERHVGLGRIGELPAPMAAKTFLQQLKTIFGITHLRYYGDTQRLIQRVAVLGGGGSFFIGQAQAADADIFVTGDIKYHDFHTAERAMLIADIGHFESEHFIKEIIFNELKENFNTFAVSLAQIEDLQICTL